MDCEYEKKNRQASCTSFQRELPQEDAFTLVNHVITK